MSQKQVDEDTKENAAKEYGGDDEIDDDVTDDVKIDREIEVAPSNLERQFLKKMNDMGFERKPDIVLIKNISKTMFLFDHRNGSETEFHKWHEHFNTLDLSKDHEATVFGEYIYIFDNKRSVFRIEYGDDMAKWERMREFHWVRSNFAPGVVASSNAIFLFNAEGETTKSIFKYDPSKDEYERLDDRPTATRWPALLCTKDFLYCIGGDDVKGNTLSIVERMDLKTMEWTRVSNMNRTIHGASCVEYRENIYVVGAVNNFGTVIKGHLPILHGLLELEMYNPKVDQWTILNSKLTDLSDEIRRAFVIDGSVIALCARHFHKYDLEKDEWNSTWIYSLPPLTEVVEAVLVYRT